MTPEVSASSATLAANQGLYKTSILLTQALPAALAPGTVLRASRQR
jgi:uncharacterized membrane protein